MENTLPRYMRRSSSWLSRPELSRKCFYVIALFITILKLHLFVSWILQLDSCTQVRISVDGSILVVFIFHVECSKATLLANFAIKSWIPNSIGEETTSHPALLLVIQIQDLTLRINRSGYPTQHR